MAAEMLTIDNGMKNQMLSFGSQVELRSQNGETFGYFLSLDTYRKLMAKYANSLVSEDELDIARAQQGGRSTQEVIARVFGK